MWADPLVTRFIGGRPFSEEETWARFLRYIGHWALAGYGFWALEERSTGAFIGEAGFMDFRRDLDPPLGTRPEAGWVLAASAHGKGYATEALTSAQAWIDASPYAPDGTLCIINAEHHASLRVAAKCGYREDRRALYRGSPIVVLSHLAPTEQPA